ncbi:MAG: cyclic pyranopterin monophosphate synthase MoaC [Polyangiales bacterium]
MADELTHLDEQGRARMVDVGGKDVTQREAAAQAIVQMAPETFVTLISGNAPKGDVLATARLAGIQAAKKTPELIPLCHHVQLTGAEVRFEPLENELRIVAIVRCSDRTGVEMEALTAATVAALTIIDMLKAIDRGLRIENVKLLWKTGGRSGDIGERPSQPPPTAR